MDCNLNSQYEVDMQTFRFNSGGFLQTFCMDCVSHCYTQSSVLRGPKLMGQANINLNIKALFKYFLIIA